MMLMVLMLIVVYYMLYIVKYYYFGVEICKVREWELKQWKGIVGLKLGDLGFYFKFSIYFLVNLVKQVDFFGIFYL